MQRRAAALSALIFLLIAAGSYVYVGVAEPPEVTVPAEETLQMNDTFVPSSGAPTVKVTAIKDSRATFTWTNESYRYTKSVKASSNLTYQGQNYSIQISNGSNVSSFTLREVQTVEKPTVTKNGTTYVIVDTDDDGTDELIPVDEWLPDPKTHNFSVGEEFTYNGNTTVVESVSSSSVTIAWTAPKRIEKPFSHGTNVTIVDTTYLMLIQDHSVILTHDYDAYQSDISRIKRHNDREKGLWGVTTLGFVSGVALLALAYMPSRY
ncbi:MAG: hypothetical protein ABEI52_02060 [Halobacteriaceae archaeon]